MSTKRFNQQTTKDNKAIKKKQKNKIVEEEEEEEEETTTSTTTTTTASPIVYHGELKCQSTTKQYAWYVSKATSETIAKGQGSKTTAVHAGRKDGLDLESDGSVGKKYKKSRDKMFTDADPHRHKYKDDKGKPLKPKFFVYYDKDGKEHRLGIVQCRQFYCNYYERLVKQQDQFKQLVQLHRTGTNLQIIGYDARHVPSDQASIDKEYLNAFKPFGHELVLFAMLIIQDESNYPWRTNKTFDF
ncbi:hypothetical protein DFA_03197 [Cavenderia fasciculata]|uniref:Uncharacterized protein n=1 Tax=Cavenderia fasciculata TaxID=261658 RepID=F4PGW8_CACFS|nr:uncharacterized protein DFA_03197 [Cavenderia fasciculata]EGG24952.1 hypothetical protein DFA_03197 [Cavenderia fasciculata]|eukprot:XP_004362803.1 hypothetical protein DFA_03197 [Cavenderia fasciculata]